MRRWYEVEGIEPSAAMRRRAARKLPEVRIRAGSFEALPPGGPYDAITCLFSAIGYLPSRRALVILAAGLARRLAPGGVLLIEPWLTPRAFRDGYTTARSLAEPGGSIAWVSRSLRRGQVSIIEQRFAVATAAGTRTFRAVHRLRLFRTGEVLDALRRAGLRAEFRPKAMPLGRGLFVARRPE